MGLDVSIERAHRIGNFDPSHKKPRTVVCKLEKYKDKDNILRNGRKLKGTDIYINEDFSKETLAIRKELWQQVLKNRSNGKISYLRYKTVISKVKPRFS